MINADLKNLWLQRITEQRDSAKTIAAWCKKQQVEWLSVKCREFSLNNVFTLTSYKALFLITSRNIPNMVILKTKAM